MARLLLVHHAPTRATQALGGAVAAGAAHPELPPVEVVVISPFDADADAVAQADAVILGTPANFGYMSGAMKDFFDRSFLALGGALGANGGSATASAGAGRRIPYALWVHGRFDTVGAVRSVEAIVSALPWRAAAPALSVLGDVTQEHEEQAYELGATLAALISE